MTAGWERYPHSGMVAYFKEVSRTISVVVIKSCEDDWFVTVERNGKTLYHKDYQHLYKEPDHPMYKREALREGQKLFLALKEGKFS